MQSLERNIHPVVIISAFNKAMKEALAVIDHISTPIDVSNDAEMLALIKASIGTKFVVRWSELMCKLAQSDAGLTTVDIKRYACMEKVPGREVEESRVLKGEPKPLRQRPPGSQHTTPTTRHDLPKPN